MTFENLGLSQPVLQALDLKGYNTPTPIQTQAIPLVLEGRDLFGIAQTGTGKTAAFMLPSIDNLREAGRQTPFKSCRMLVLAPTRELVGQIAQSAKDYGAMAGLRVDSVVGGTSVSKDRNKLHRGTDILVATPGRLLDLIDQKAFILGGVEILVLDEADQMLDLGFIHALRRIVGLVPQKRQTLLFSATMPKSIRELAGQYLRDPANVAVTPQATTAERVEQYVCYVNQSEKQALLTVFLDDGFKSGEIDRVLVFTRTKHGADRVVRKLAESRIPASAIHGNKSQPQRELALGQFRQGKIRVLVATDVAARGIDIPGVSHVVNFELPNVAEQYVHRIGRTARAGASGIAFSMCASDEKAYLRDIQKLTRVTLDQVPLPEGFRALVDSIDEHSRIQAQRPKQTATVKPRGERTGQQSSQGRDKPKDGQPRGGSGRRHSSEGQSEHNAHPARQDRRSGMPTGGGGGNRRRRRGGGGGGGRPHSASGGQRG